MLAVGVVVAFDVVEDFQAGIISVFKAAALEHLALEGADEGLGPGVVVGVGARRHALAHAGTRQRLTEAGTAVLAAAVTVEDRVLGWTRSERLTQGGHDQVATQMIPQAPADDAARAQIDDDGQVEPTCASGNEGDVTSPSTIGNFRWRLAGEQVGRGPIRPPVAGFWHVVLGLEGVQASLCHQAADPRRRTDHAPVGEFLADPAVAVAAAVAFEDGFNERAKLGVGALGGSRCGGVIEAAARQFQGGTHRPHTAAGLPGDLGDHRASGERGLVPRMMAAFFKMSFSSLRWEFSRRSRANSAMVACWPSA